MSNKAIPGCKCCKWWRKTSCKLTPSLTSTKTCNWNYICGRFSDESTKDNQEKTT